MRQLFTQEEIAEIARQFDAIMDEDKEGREPPTGKCGFCSGPCIDRMHSVYGIAEKPPLQWLPEDDRIYLTLEELLGRNFAWVGSEGQRYSGDTDWHPDGAMFDLRRIKVSVYLDPLTKETGCMRVVSGSHLPALNESLRPLRDPESPFGVESSDVPSHAIETGPGDVLFFNMSLWHATFGGSKGRRQIAMVTIEDPSTEAHLEFIRGGHEHTKRIMEGHQYDFRSGRQHEDSFLNSNRPRIKGMVSKLVELGYR